VERFAVRRRDGVDFGRKTSARAAQSIALDPPFPPAASWCARTTEPSMREPTSSPIRSSLKTRSHTPRFAQRANRLYVVFQLPYRSGISRQGAPVLRRHMTAFTNTRSPRFETGPGLTGSRPTIVAHCPSLSSCRCMEIVPHEPISQANFPPQLIGDTP
jgi:hypothetical protein